MTKSTCVSCLISLLFSLALELAPPIFLPVTVNKGQTLQLRCLDQNPSLIGRIEIRNPGDMMVATLLYSVPNVTRSFAGTYSCVAISRLNASVTITVTTTVTVQCEWVTIQLLFNLDHSLQPTQSMVVYR